ncbi:hypothetical protein HDK90DRAFT_186662 [Phyllosticta capitalensis]|uniref:Uncharacterized protein n=1 Tax=Phyllosticta capitalensis TaxID=121624 RepID=A0ABR1YWD5_9PEZI
MVERAAASDGLDAISTCRSRGRSKTGQVPRTPYDAGRVVRIHRVLFALTLPTWLFVYTGTVVKSLAYFFAVPLESTNNGLTRELHICSGVAMRQHVPQRFSQSAAPFCLLLAPASSLSWMIGALGLASATCLMRFTTTCRRFTLQPTPATPSPLPLSCVVQAPPRLKYIVSVLLVPLLEFSSVAMRPAVRMLPIMPCCVSTTTAVYRSTPKPRTWSILAGT